MPRYFILLLIRYKYKLWTDILYQDQDRNTNYGQMFHNKDRNTHYGQGINADHEP